MMAGTVASAAPDLAGLLDRIAEIRVLRGHHVWGVDRLLSPGVLEQSADRTRRHLDALREAGTLVCGGDHSVCSIRCGQGHADHGLEAEHADQAAALLASPLRPCRHGEQGRLAGLNCRESERGTDAR